MTANNTETSFDTIEMYFNFGVITIASFSLFINLTVFFAGMKVLKKDLHNLLVMLLCFGNGSNGLLAILRSISSLLPEFYTVTSCQFATFGTIYGTLISPFVISMISLERFLMTKALHYGMINMLNRKKHIIITGSLAFPFLVSSSVFAVPNSSTQTCNADGENFKVVLYIIGTTWASVVMVTIVTTILTGVCIWRAINRRKAAAVHPEPNARTRQPSPPKSNDSHITRVYSEKAQNKDNQIYPYVNWTEIQDSSAIEENASFASQSCSTYDEQNVSKQVDKANKGDKMARFANLKGLNIIGSEQVNAIADNDESSASSKIPIDRHKNTALKQNNKGMTLKIRALQTNIIVGATTLLLTGPFIVSLLRGLPDETSRLLSGVFYVLCFVNSIVDPFVYIWRVTRIRKQLKTVCKFD